MVGQSMSHHFIDTGLVIMKQTKEAVAKGANSNLGVALREASKKLNMSPRDVAIFCFARQFDQILHEVQQAPPRKR